MSGAGRTIIHVDLDAFYSSVEQRDRPELRGRPVVVGGDPDGRGVVATASYEARRFGVRSAMPCRTARRLCPGAIFVRPRFEVYRGVSEQVMAIFGQVTDLIEPVALDEAFLDVSAVVADEPGAEGIGRALKDQIRAATSLTASLGIAGNKLVAKVASDFHKPDGLTLVKPGEERRFLSPLPVRTLWGVGPRAEERLHRAGIKTAGALADAAEGAVLARFGRLGLGWQRLARGVDDRPVTPSTPRRQLSRERTFASDVRDAAELHVALRTMAEEIAALMEGRQPARTATLKLRYADFSTVT
ncbi:MAG: DNA polymerase IV, partial [Chloroflexi bacterium]|nr:DNA polymerase IV [Chloroflexota bacterium]